MINEVKLKLNTLGKREHCIPTFSFESFSVHSKRQLGFVPRVAHQHCGNKCVLISLFFLLPIRNELFSIFFSLTAEHA